MMRQPFSGSAVWLPTWGRRSRSRFCSGCCGPPSIGGFPVGVAVGGAFENLKRRPDLRLGWLQDRVSGGPGPRRERLAQVAVPGVLGGDGQALAGGEPLGE